jgi:hypothetical protein
MLADDGARIYPVAEGIADFDLDTDIEEYDYDGRKVYRGNIDLDLSEGGREVYWLYENDTRVGLAEHRGETHTCYWYRDNVYSTLLQEDWQVYDETIWNILPQKAYDECMRHGWTTVPKLQARTQLSLATPDDFVSGAKVSTSVCERCAAECSHAGCVPIQRAALNEKNVFSVIFLDDEGTIYIPPSDTKAYATLRRRGAAAAAAAAGTTTGGDSTTTGAGGGGDAEPAPASAGYPPSSSSSSSSSANAARAPPDTIGTASPSS